MISGFLACLAQKFAPVFCTPGLTWAENSSEQGGEGRGEMLAGVEEWQRFKWGRGVADGEGLAGPLSQLERMVFSIQEVYLQICV